jgi:hypothetical protein
VPIVSSTNVSVNNTTSTPPKVTASIAVPPVPPVQDETAAPVQANKDNAQMLQQLFNFLLSQDNNQSQSLN